LGSNWKSKIDHRLDFQENLIFRTKLVKIVESMDCTDDKKMCLFQFRVFERREGVQLQPLVRRQPQQGQGQEVRLPESPLLQVPILQLHHLLFTITKLAL
jgi:hypothetical protein